MMAQEETRGLGLSGVSLVPPDPPLVLVTGQGAGQACCGEPLIRAAVGSWGKGQRWLRPMLTGKGVGVREGEAWLGDSQRKSRGKDVAHRRPF
jgi:hypothetical protein